VAATEESAADEATAASVVRGLAEEPAPIQHPPRERPRAVRPVAAVVLPAPVPPAAGEHRSDRESAPDVVHVSIGRIDVRATVTSPATEVRAQPPRPEALSLHDYLRGERSR
jgi:hypothetical protein